VDRAIERFEVAPGEERAHALDRVMQSFGSPRCLPRPSRRQRDQAFALLTRLVLRDADPEVRRVAAHGLGFWGERRATAVLLWVLGQPNERPDIRGQAAEGIGHEGLVFSGDIPPPSPLRERAVAGLRAGLRDAAPEVRFWCLYGLGQLQAREARPEIEALTGDRSLCPYTWWVGEEAQDVLAYWDTGDWPERDFRPPE
jgi:hypothetical protein